MRTNRSLLWAASVLAIWTAASCGASRGPAASVVRPGAPGEASQVLDPTAPAGARTVHTDADVRFIRAMIPHHEQALVLAELVASRTTTDAIRVLARRIDLSQRDEIELMRRWLEARGEAVPGIGTEPDANAHAGHATLMPGMLTEEDLARLAGATGAAFDRLFLGYMIQHHEGARIMVADLFATPGGGQESAVFQFATHVEADQSAEIARMRRMLDAGP